MTKLQKQETKKTLIWTKNHPKHPQTKTYFYSAKLAPQKVDKLITLKVAKLITLWRPKGGQTNNSPAYIYMYIYTEFIFLRILGSRPVYAESDHKDTPRYSFETKDVHSKKST